MHKVGGIGQPESGRAGGKHKEREREREKEEFDYFSKLVQLNLTKSEFKFRLIQGLRVQIIHSSPYFRKIGKER